jgi:hypothetical protein
MSADLNAISQLAVQYESLRHLITDGVCRGYDVMVVDEYRSVLGQV